MVRDICYFHVPCTQKWQWPLYDLPLQKDLYVHYGARMLLKDKAVPGAQSSLLCTRICNNHAPVGPVPSPSEQELCLTLLSFPHSNSTRSSRDICWLM